MKKTKLVVAVFCVMFLFSCVKDSGMRITSNTFADKKVIPQGFALNSSFSIATKQKGDALFTQEVSKKIATILKNKGFAVKANDEADYTVNFAFGMKKSTHVRDVPVFIPDYGYWYYHHWHHPYHYGYNVAYIPEEYTLFNKILFVEVYKNTTSEVNASNEAEKAIPVWQGTAHGYEEDSDLRDAIDFLLITVFRHFGYNTQRYVKSRMEESDPEVEKLRQDYFQPIGYVGKP